METLRPQEAFSEIDQGAGSEWDLTVADQMWKDPSALPEATASFFAHFQVIQQRAEEKGLVTEYDKEALSTFAQMEDFHETMMTYNDMLQFMHDCRDHMGMSDSFISSIASQEDEHAHHNHAPGVHGHGEKKKDGKEGKGKKKYASSIIELAQAVLSDA